VTTPTGYESRNGEMLAIDVYSDVICPWCFVGKRRLEKGLVLAGKYAAVRWHPFELNPDMPREGMERRAYRVKKFGSWERSLELDAQVGRAFAGEGLAFNPDGMARTPNTFDTHRVIWLAGEGGVQDAVVEALFRAYFTDGRDLSDRATLAAVAGGSGLDPGEVNELLSGGRGAAEVRGWEQRGQRLGISGVPFFVVNGRVALSGAQPPELFRQAFEQAGEAVVTGEACEVDPATGKGGC
jgi:predicted DsbA family dithiol-disulfide isomerase